ncbi:MAG: RNA polymerase sigma factor [Breznakibacter sp.]
MKLVSEQMIKDCQQGKRQAQRAIYELLAPKMYAVCLRYTHNQAEAEDCLQDGFVKVFNRIGDFRFEGVFEGWVRRIIVNTVIEQFRKKPQVRGYDALENLSDEPLHEDMDVGGLNAAFLLELVRELPPQYQIVFSLYAIEGYPHEEIAQKLGINVGTSKSNLSRARKWLQQRLAMVQKLDNKIYASTASDR